MPVAFLIRLINFIKKIFGKKKKFSIPIICVGNIYLGGTGKTPLCIEIFQIIKNLGKKPVFIKKKYKSFIDETRLLKQTGSVYENYKRVEAINDAIRNNANMAILDDGFQDFSVRKDLSILCFNERQWIGNGLVIPSGPLRENFDALNRANLVVINGKKNTNIENKILKHNKLIKIFYTEYKLQDTEKFKNKKIIAFAGIANPNNFFDLLKENNINVLDKIPFPDHYNYSKIELDNLIKKAKENNLILLTTEKDFLRLEESYKENINCLKIRLEIKNKNQFIEEIKKFI